MSATAIETAPERRTPWPATSLTFGGFVLFCVIMLHPAAASMATTWASSSTYHHGFLVAPLAIWMIWRDAAQNGWPAFSASIQPAAGAAIALLFWLIGHAAGIALIEQTAFVSILIAGVASIFGLTAFKRWLFPLLFLFFMVPIGEALIPLLQDITAGMIMGFLSLTGINAALNGVLITTPAGAFNVAEACAGLRFLIAAAMVAALYAYITFASWQKQIVFIVFAMALAVLANGLRASLMVWMATITDMRLATGPEHIVAGWIVYLGAFIALVLVGRRFADAPTKNRSGKMATSREKRFKPVLVAPVFALVLTTSLYARIIIDKPVDTAPPTSLSLFNAPGWRLLPPPNNWRASFAGADRTAFASYTNVDHIVHLAAGYFTHDRTGAEIVNFQNSSFDRQEWRKVDTITETVYVFGHAEPVDIDLIRGPDGARIAALPIHWLEGEAYTDKWRLKSEQAKRKLTGANPRGGLIIIASPYDDDPSDALAAIRAFTVDVETLHDWVSRIDLQEAP